MIFLRPFLPNRRRRWSPSLSEAEASESEEEDEEESSDEEESEDEDDEEEEEEEEDELLASSSLEDWLSFGVDFLVFSVVSIELERIIYIAGYTVSIHYGLRGNVLKDIYSWDWWALDFLKK